MIDCRHNNHTVDFFVRCGLPCGNNVICERRQDVTNDRRCSAILAAAALNAKSNGMPWDKVYMMIDAANQSNFATPLSADNAHGIDDKQVSETNRTLLLERVGIRVFEFTPNPRCRFTNERDCCSL